MKTFELLNKRISIDTEKISLGLIKIHNQDENISTRLKFGLLDAKIIETSEKNIAESVMNQFEETDIELFKPRVIDFIKEVNKEITKGIYQRAKMVV